MTTEGVEQVKADAVVPDPLGDAAPQQEPDLAAQFEQLKTEFEAQKAQWTKERESFRSQEIAALKQEDRDRFSESLSESFAVLAESLGNEEVSAKLAAINAKRQQATLTASFQTDAKKAMDDFQDKGKEFGLDIETAREFDLVRLNYNKAIETGNDRWLEKSIAEAERAARKIESDRSKKAVAETKKQAEVTRKQTLEQSGILETSTGGSAASGAEPAVNELVARYNANGSLTKEQRAKVYAYLDALDDTPGSLVRSRS